MDVAYLAAFIGEPPRGSFTTFAACIERIEGVGSTFGLELPVGLRRSRP